jgi:multiple sugar transport system substrate-binding protein
MAHEKKEEEFYMKKFLAILMVAALVVGLAACTTSNPTQPAESQATKQAEESKTEKAKDDETKAPVVVSDVVYYCNVGAYRKTLSDAIDEFNAGEGKEKGCKIVFDGDINSYTDSLIAFMQAGTHFDLIDKGTGSQDWISQGWILDLYSIQADYPELDALIKSYEPYISIGGNVQQGILCNLPLEVVPLKYVANTDLLAAVGKKAEDIKTWKDMYEAAKAIKEANLKTAAGEDVFGFGWSTWGSCWSRLTFQTLTNSTGRTYFDPNTSTYDYTLWKEPCEYIKKMYEEGIMLGADDLAIDPIRAEFAKGRVGFFGAPSYDYAVYTEQFPAAENNVHWTVIEPPVFGENGGKYKGSYLDRCGVSIDKVQWEAADANKKQAMVTALCFINSDDLLQRIYEMGGLITYKAEVNARAKISDDMGPQWALFGDISKYRNTVLFPDSLAKPYLEGDIHNKTFDNWLHNPNLSYDEMAADLTKRYNEAWAEAQKDPDLDIAIYKYAYDMNL